MAGWAFVFDGSEARRAQREKLSRTEELRAVGE